MMKVKKIHFESIDSTNTWAKNNAHFLEKKDLTLITADAQTGGRGRFKRLWVSPAFQNIYATFCFFLENLRDDVGNIPQVLSLSVVKILEDLNFDPKVKWPNDILLSNKKVGGILCETTFVEKDFCVVLGIGLNVNMERDALMKIDRPATSLYVERGSFFSVAEVQGRLTEQFCHDLDLFLKEGFSPFLKSYKEHMQLKRGDKLIFSDQGKEQRVHFDSINADGSLNLQLEGGTIKRFVSGEFV